jgi:hypothetical protein
VATPPNHLQNLEAKQSYSGGGAQSAAGSSAAHALQGDRQKALEAIRSLLHCKERKIFDKKLNKNANIALRRLIDKSVNDSPKHAWLGKSLLRFASGDPETAGMPGSLYFEKGRIRLVHKNGPQVKYHENPMRYTITQKGRKEHNRLKKEGQKTATIYDTLKKHLTPFDQVSTSSKDRLFEVFKENGKTITHLSRGSPIKAPELTQQEINLLARAATKKGSDKRMNNERMKSIYKAIQ